MMLRLGYIYFLRTVSVLITTHTHNSSVAQCAGRSRVCPSKTSFGYRLLTHYRHRAGWIVVALEEKQNSLCSYSYSSSLCPPPVGLIYWILCGAACFMCFPVYLLVYGCLADFSSEIAGRWWNVLTQRISQLFAYLRFGWMRRMDNQMICSSVLEKSMVIVVWIIFIVGTYWRLKF